MYGPNLSELSAVSVRRLAWAMGASMGKAVEVMAQCLPGFIRAEKVCEKCRDKTRCKACAFKNSGELPAGAAALLH